MKWRGEFGTSDDGGMNQSHSSFVLPKERRKSSTREEGRKADGSGSVCVLFI